MLKQSKKSIMSNFTKVTSSLLIAVIAIILSAFNFYERPTMILENKINVDVKNTPKTLPIHKEDIDKLASGFGMRKHPDLKTEKMHTGVDFIAPKGTSIIATADGEVIFADFLKGYGNHVIIKHDNTYQTLYAHMDEISVKKGQQVKSGERIGVIGTTGKSLGIHLHYEVIENGKKVDPVLYFN